MNKNQNYIQNISISRFIDTMFRRSPEQAKLISSPETRQAELPKRESIRRNESGLDLKRSLGMLLSTLVVTAAFLPEGRANEPLHLQELPQADGELHQVIKLGDMDLPVTAVAPENIERWFEMLLEAPLAEKVNSMDDPDVVENLPDTQVKPIALGTLSTSFELSETASLAIGGPKFSELAEGNYGGNILFTLELPNLPN